MSIAGDESLAATADESYLVDYEGSKSPNTHQWVIFTHQDLLNNELYNQMFNSKDLEGHTKFQGYFNKGAKGKIYSTEPEGGEQMNRGEIQFLLTKQNSGFVEYGTVGENTFENFDSYYKGNVELRGFGQNNKGDKISLMGTTEKGLPGAKDKRINEYYIYQDSIYPTISRKYCNETYIGSKRIGRTCESRDYDVSFYGDSFDSDGEELGVGDVEQHLEWANSGDSVKENKSFIKFR